MGPIPVHNCVTIEKREVLLFLIANITKRFEASGNIYSIKNSMRESNTKHIFLLKNHRFCLCCIFKSPDYIMKNQRNRKTDLLGKT